MKKSTLITILIVALIFVAMIFAIISSKKKSDAIYKAKIEQQRIEDSLFDIKVKEYKAKEDSLNLVRQKEMEDEIKNSFRVTSLRFIGPNSAGGCGASIYFKNLSKKTIKYIFFSAYPINAVDDRVPCEIRGYDFGRLKYTGPLNPGASDGGLWDDVWYNHSARKVIIEKIEIQFMDGSLIVVPESMISAVGL